MMESRSALLAKGLRRGRPPLSVEQHLLDTESAAIHLFGPDSRWGASWRRFFRLGEQYDRFLAGLRVAALFHDIGKANADFQGAVTNRTDQTLRHEHLSALVLHLPEIRAWLERPGVIDFDAVSAAVLSHHLKASESGDWKWGQPRTARSRIELHLAHAEVASTLRRVGELVGAPPPVIVLPSHWCDDALWRSVHEHGVRSARAFGREVRRNHERRRLLLATKAAVIAADSVASAIVREDLTLDEWVAGVTGARLTADDIRGAVIEPRMRESERRSGVPFAWHRFQELAAEQSSRSLLLAACGAGKSLAAWRWAERVAANSDIGRVVFLYPTRGTATEGFRDYVGAAPEADAALLHGSAEYELRGMCSNPEDRFEGRDFTTDERLFALGYWSKRYFSATVDQFLGFMAHSYKGLCLLPALADAAVIVDEVHSFDRRMFDSLIGFLAEFDVPVLCMTATLSGSRRSAIEARGLRTFPSPDERAQLEDLERLERHPRYALVLDSSPERALVAAREALQNGHRVLWVVNRVAECQRIAALFGDECIVYHSRFQLRHRQNAHRRTVAAFREHRAVVAVTTQVCEMSLDLDADLLVTELAPPASLVQRFGRANRHLARGPEFRAAIHVYEPDSPRPYQREELLAARNMLAALDVDAVDQSTLARVLEEHSPVEPMPEGSASFLDSGYYAVATEFRDADEFTSPCVLDSDLGDVLAALRAKQPINGFILPVPRGEFTSEAEGLPSFLRVARASNYDERIGYSVE